MPQLRVRVTHLILLIITRVWVLEKGGVEAPKKVKRGIWGFGGNE